MCVHSVAILCLRRYFEDKGVTEKAVQLYHRCGALGKALDICFRYQLYDDLQSIADDLSAGMSLYGNHYERDHPFIFFMQVKGKERHRRKCFRNVLIFFWNIRNTKKRSTF